jgi:hypothetical protein
MAAVRAAMLSFAVLNAFLAAVYFSAPDGVSLSPFFPWLHAAGAVVFGAIAARRER